jgi:hypothetical protein
LLRCAIGMLEVAEASLRWNTTIVSGFRIEIGFMEKSRLVDDFKLGLDGHPRL